MFSASRPGPARMSIVAKVRAPKVGCMTPGRWATISPTRSVIAKIWLEVTTLKGQSAE